MPLCSSSCKETNCQFVFCFSSSGVCHLDFAVVKHCNPLCVFQYFSALTDCSLTACARIVWNSNYCDLLLVVGPSMHPCDTLQLSAPALSDTHQTFVHLPPAHSGYHFPIRDCWGQLAESSWWAHCVPGAITTDSRITDVTYSHIHTHSLPRSLSAHAVAVVHTSVMPIQSRQSCHMRSQKAAQWW